MGQYSTTDAANKLGMNARTVKRLCREHGIGGMVGGVRILVEADLAKLLPFKGRKSGNPNWRKAEKPVKKRAKKRS